jgi:hypothetical protein
MGKPFRKAGSKNYYVELRSRGERRTVALETSNDGIAKAKASQLELEARTSGLKLPTQTELGDLVEEFVH